MVVNPTELELLETRVLLVMDADGLADKARTDDSALLVEELEGELSEDKLPESVSVGTTDEEPDTGKAEYGVLVLGLVVSLGVTETVKLEPWVVCPMVVDELSDSTVVEERPVGLRVSSVQGTGVDIECV